MKFARVFSPVNRPKERLAPEPARNEMPANPAVSGVHYSPFRYFLFTVHGATVHGPLFTVHGLRSTYSFSPGGISSTCSPASLSSWLRQSSDSTNRFDSRQPGSTIDVQLEIDARAQQRLDLAPRAGADVAQLGPAFADQDRLLAVALAVDGGGDAGQRRTPGPPFFAAVVQAPALRTAR